jgi:hypothetical protein
MVTRPPCGQRRRLPENRRQHLDARRRNERRDRAGGCRGYPAAIRRIVAIHGRHHDVSQASRATASATRAGSGVDGERRP